MESYDRLIATAEDLATAKPFARQQEVVKYVDERFQRENIVVPRNLARVPPFMRYGQSTNNVCEQFNSAILEARALPLGLCVDNIIALTSKWRLEHSQSAVARGLKAVASPEQLRLHITPTAVEHIEMLIAKCTDGHRFMERFSLIVLRFMHRFSSYFNTLCLGVNISFQEGPHRCGGPKSSRIGPFGVD